MEPPYLQVVADLRRRIEAGEFAPGDRVPSTRQLTRDWGVALATASKALRVLIEDGTLRAVPRVGTVVAAAPPTRPTRREPELSRDRVVRAAIAIADTDGLAALSMRSVAARLGVATMAPYRHVDGKDELILLMIDEAFGQTAYPDSPPSSWRAGLEMAAHAQWRAYREHPWVAHAVSLTRPQVLPKAMAHTEWMVAALAPLGLPAVEIFHIYLTVFNYVRGTAVNLEWEREAESTTGMTNQQWIDSHNDDLAAVLASGRYPALAATLTPDADIDLVLDDLFEFGLLRLLDGLELHLGHRDPVAAEVDPVDRGHRH
ncbi:TetR/AcrR family transcriptional regulator C-terminal domain-containing protein [Actinokineospora enzanensis]|uniref:TetR/AcrR family transcriptional regulator C-terminal domain-containing protein n=1 Tax=Actinokineospora enzanensis TaxID=155975 RepID=UPI00036BEA92|nr:TetR/AcrR family transcriptional regulator C-terminal domain-containing protein [Actinokineospora enzanensis]